MPLLPSTQTKTANGVPLYVPMDGEGNATVPSSLTVNGGILSTFLPDGSVFTGASGGFPSIQFTNPASSIPSTLVGLQDSGTLLVGNNSVPVGMTGPLTVPSIFGLGASSPINPAVFGAAGAAQWSNNGTASQVTFVVAGYRLTVGTFVTGGDGKATIEFVTPYNAGGIPAIVCTPQTSGTGGGGVKGFVCMGEDGSGSTSSPTNTGFQCISVQANGSALTTACCFFAFGPA